MGTPLPTLAPFTRRRDYLEELILLPYQIEGKDFLIAKERAMLCDQVGLGKSIQSIEAIKEITDFLSPQYKWILTATPIQNNIKELYSLLEFLNGKTITDIIEKLNTRQGGWKNYVYERPGLSGPPSRRMFLSAISGKSEDQLYAAMTDLMLRRVRTNDTPPSVKTYRLDMNADQLRIDRQLKHDLQSYIKDTLFNVTNALALITRRRQVANTPQLINPKYQKITPKLREIIAIAQDMILFDEKVIFFSDFRKMIDIVSTLLTKKNMAHVKLTGHHTCNPDSEKEKFLNDSKIHILLATKTGEEGHNLQKAHHIVNIDLPYNPKRITQRIGRCDRIGQSHAVQVINLHSIESVEDRILTIIYEKEKLFDDTINIHNQTIELDRTKIRQIAQ